MYETCWYKHQVAIKHNVYVLSCKETEREDTVYTQLSGVMVGRLGAQIIEIYR